MIAIAAVVLEVLGGWNQSAQIRCLMVVLVLAGAATVGVLGAGARFPTRGRPQGGRTAGTDLSKHPDWP